MKTEIKETATELEFLKWFYCNVDFGPADSDVSNCLKLEFVDRTHKFLPIGYDLLSDGETNANEAMSKMYLDQEKEDEK